MPPKNSSYVMTSERKVERQETFTQKVVYYCSNCQCECIPCLPKPLVENKIADAIIVSFDSNK